MKTFAAIENVRVRLQSLIKGCAQYVIAHLLTVYKAASLNLCETAAR